MASHPDPTDNGRASPAEEPKSGVLPTVPPRSASDPTVRTRESGTRESVPDWAPDSSVPSSVPVARVALARHGAAEEPSVTRVVHLALVVRADNVVTAAAYVTLSLPGGRVAFEGATDAEGILDVALVVPVDTRELLLLVEHGTKYRHATIPLGGGEHVSYELG